MAASERMGCRSTSIRTFRSPNARCAWPSAWREPPPRRRARWRGRSPNSEDARAQNAQAELARQRGSTDPDEINDASWAISDEFFAILAFASPELAARVDRFMDARWDEWTQNEIRAAMALRRIARESDPPREVVVAARRKVAPWKAGWTRRRRRIARTLATLAAERANAGDAGNA